MKKNVAGQVVSFVMVSASDGVTAVTSGTPTVYVTIDGGTQATGTGTATHEGNGEWSYVPTQAETNGDHLFFLMSLSGALPCGANIYTTFPQSADGPTAISALQTHGDGSWATSTLTASEIWGFDGRTLSSFGSLVADVATAVWGFTGRTLASFSDSSGITTLLSRLSSARAAYLDKLNVTGVLAHSDAADTYKASVSGLSTITEAQINAQVDQALADVGLTTDVTGRIDAAVSSRLASGNVTVGDIVKAALARLATIDIEETPVDGSVIKLSQGEAGSLTAEGVAAAVWDESLSGHATSGSAGAAMSAAGAAGVSGSVAVTYTVTTGGGEVVAQAAVEIYAEVECATLLRSLVTNDLGVASTRLDPGTYYVWIRKAGVTFSDLPDTLEVTA